MTRHQVISKARSWTVKLEVHGAPETWREYSQHLIRPDRVEISYLDVYDGRGPHLNNVAVFGSSASNPGLRLNEVWYPQQAYPAWLQELIDGYLPRVQEPVYRST